MDSLSFSNIETSRQCYPFALKQNRTLTFIPGRFKPVLERIHFNNTVVHRYLILRVVRVQGKVGLMLLGCLQQGVHGLRVGSFYSKEEIVKSHWRHQHQSERIRLWRKDPCFSNNRFLIFLISFRYQFSTKSINWFIREVKTLEASTILRLIFNLYTTHGQGEVKIE